MRRLSVVLCVAMSLCQARISIAQTSQAGTASLWGAVKGLDGPAVVYLVSQNADPTSYYDGYQAASDKNGNFSFAYIKPGTYRIRAEAAGFLSLPSEGEGAEITLRAGEKRTGVSVQMVRRQTVCGRVTENEVPRERPTWVWAYRYDKDTGETSRTFLPATKPDGTYRFDDLQSGTYYLQGYTTWYPGSFNFNGAQPVTVAPTAGSSDCPFNIALQYTGCHATKVTGLIGAPSDNGAQYHLNFFERNASGASMPSVIIMNNGTGLYRAGDHFSVSMCPGDYDVVLSDQQGYGTSGEFRAHKVILDSQTITVGSTQIDNVVLTPHPMASIKGEVHFEGITRNASCPGQGGQYVDILRAGDAQFQSATLDEKNRFQFQNVAPGNYSVYLAPFLSEAVYLKSIMINGQASEGRDISISDAAPARLDITLSGDLEHAAGHLPPDLRRVHRWEVEWMRPKASVSGKVIADAPSGYTVKLQSARYNSNASGKYTAKTTPDGAFHFEGVDPGVYTLRADADGAFSVEFGAREAGTQGTPIVVERGAQLRDLTVAPPKLGSICGRVSDANGAASSDTKIFVQAFQYREFTDYYNSISYQGRGPHIELSTNHDGLFRADRLVPGDYYIGFRWQNRIPYFSDDGSLSAETPIRIRAGESLGCSFGKPLGFRIPEGLDQLHVISGQIVGDIPKSDGDRFSISLVSETPGGQAYAGYASIDDKRQFHLDGVPKGTYLLQLLSAYGPAPMVWSGPYGPVSHLLASQKIEVQTEDVLGLVIRPERLATVSGKVRFENLPAEWKGNFAVTSQILLLIPNEYRAPLGGKLAADGTFTIDAGDPGDYEVTLAQPGSQLYVRSLFVDGHPIEGRHLRLQMGQTANLEVVIGGDAGHILAAVAPDLSLPKPEPPVEQPCDHQAWPAHQLILFPDPFPSLTADFDLLAQPTVFFGHPVRDDEDHIRIGVDALPPGTYRALAAENLQRGFSLGGWNEVPLAELQLWSKLAALGEPITVRAGQKLDLTLPDKTVDVARLAAQWGLRLDVGVMN